MSHQHWNYPELMRQRGFRVTPQRQLILDAVCEGGGHSTPEEIYERVRVKAPTLNRATVYRALDFLCELRLVVAAQIGGRWHYEIASETPHHHLICRQCNAELTLKHAAVRLFFEQIAHEQQFVVDMQHLTLFGLCRKCAATERRAPRKTVAK